MSQSEPQRHHLLPYPTGWLALAFSSELARGQVQRGQFFGRELVLFRGEGGEAAALDAHCPHLGAHMGYGGRVEGDALRCPFHAFCFDARGVCVSTPYGRRLPRTQARAWPLVERNGAVFVWYDEAERAPLWELPEVDFSGFAPMRTKVWGRLSSHPQETTENSVDLGHLSVVHGYEDVEMVEPLRTEGPYLTATYGMRRKNPFLPGMPRIRTTFNIHVHGLGYSYIHVRVPDQGIEGHSFVLPTPIDGESIQLRAAMAIRAPDPKAVALPLGLLPRGLATRIIAKAALLAYTRDIEQDFDIWENKRYIAPPSLAEGDGPVGPYRSWCKQFYRSAV